METSRACFPELMTTSRDEGKRSLMYKIEEEEEEDDGEETGSELGSGVEHGRKTWVISNAYSKRGPKSGSSPVPPCCQVDYCHPDLSDAREYGRRHNVCEHHAKAPIVLISGHEQRFCQHCGRFHELSEFDTSKRRGRRGLGALCEILRTASSDYHGKAATGSPLLPPPLPPLPPTQSRGASASGFIRPGSMADRARMAHIPMPEAALKCPRCDSTNTQFCYFNNYSLAISARPVEGTGPGVGPCAMFRSAGDAGGTREVKEAAQSRHR